MSNGVPSHCCCRGCSYFSTPTYGAGRTNSTIIYNAGSRPASSVNGIEVGNARVKVPHVTKYRDE